MNKFIEDAPTLKVGDDVLVAPGGMPAYMTGGEVISISEDCSNATIRLSEQFRNDEKSATRLIRTSDVAVINGHLIFDFLLSMDSMVPVPGVGQVVEYGKGLQQEQRSPVQVSMMALGQLAYSAKLAQGSMVRSHIKVIETSGEALSRAGAASELVEIGQSLILSAITASEARSDNDDFLTRNGTAFRYELFSLPVDELRTLLNEEGVALLDASMRGSE